jgi:hypothetical protein
MTVCWNGRYNPNPLAEHIEQNTTRLASGKASFAPFRFTEYEVLLCSMLEFTEPIPGADARRIVRQAISTAAETGTVTASALLREVNRLENAYSARPLKRYVMVTSLSVSRLASLPRCRLGNTVIILEPQTPARYQAAASGVIAEARHWLPADPPHDYLSTRIHVSARSESHAAEVALETLHLVRGIWNWCHNRQQLTRESSGKTWPVNRIVPGPLHTLHQPGGKLATQTWWYEGGYCGPLRVYNPSGEVQGMYKFLRSVRNRLARCRYPGVIRQAIVRYTIALDLQDWDAAFLKLWSVLELLTASSRQATDVTIKRTAFIYEDREYVVQLLKHLADYRNRFVHADKSDSRIETCLYQIKNFVEALLSFHLQSRYRFESMGQATEFLDLPSQRGVIESRLKMMKYAHRFRGYA